MKSFNVRDTGSYSLVLKDALRDAAGDLISNGFTNVTPSMMVFWVLKQAMDTLTRMRDPEAAWLSGERNSMPDIVHSREERLEAYREEMKMLLSGEQSVEESRRRAPAHPVAIKRMFVVFEEFPYMLVGKDRRRCYCILCGLASGKSATVIGRKVGMTKAMILDRKAMQLSAIATKLTKVMPSPRDLSAMIGAYDAVVKDKELKYSALESSDSGV